MGGIELQDLGGAVLYLGALAIAITAIGIVVRVVVVRPLKTWLREQIKPDLTEVHAQVTPNHGTSIKDAVGRIEKQQRKQGKRLNEHLTNHPGATRREDHQP